MSKIIEKKVENFSTVISVSFFAEYTPVTWETKQLFFKVKNPYNPEKSTSIRTQLKKGVELKDPLEPNAVYCVEAAVVIDKFSANVQRIIVKNLSKVNKDKWIVADCLIKADLEDDEIITYTTTVDGQHIFEVLTKNNVGNKKPIWLRGNDYNLHNLPAHGDRCFDFYFKKTPYFATWDATANRYEISEKYIETQDSENPKQLFDLVITPWYPPK